MANSTAEYETLESEVSALHDDLWEQLNLDIQVSVPRCPLSHAGGSHLIPLLRANLQAAAGAQRPALTLPNSTQMLIKALCLGC